MTRRSPRPRAYAPDPDAPGRCCDMPGCGAAGEYRAPKSRTVAERLLVVLPGACARLQRRLGFLQGHDARRDRGADARRYVLAAPDLAARPSRRAAATTRHAARSAACAECRRRPRRGRQRRRAAAERRAAELREPLAALGLAWPMTLAELKTRYKELAKQHHPDANDGDRGGGGTAEDDQPRLCRAARPAAAAAQPLAPPADATPPPRCAASYPMTATAGVVCVPANTGRWPMNKLAALRRNPHRADLGDQRARHHGVRARGVRHRHRHAGAGLLRSAPSTCRTSTRPIASTATRRWRSSPASPTTAA